MDNTSRSLLRKSLSSVEPASQMAMLASEVLSGFIEYAKEREKWHARVASLRETFEQHGLTEDLALQDRKLSAQILAQAATDLINSGNSDKVIELFKIFNQARPDYLGRVVELVKQVRAGQE